MISFLSRVSSRKSLEKQIAQLQQQILELQREKLEWQALAQIDGLTGCKVRREFDVTMEAEWRRSMRSRFSLCVIFIDLDHLKALNTQHGHLVANDKLACVGEILLKYTQRAGQEAFRFGGDELAVVLPGFSLKEGIAIAQLIRTEVEQHDCTVSQGVAAIIPSPDKTWCDLIETANQQMFLAKNSGRNCVMPAVKTE